MKKIFIFAVIALFMCDTAFAQKDWANFGRYQEANTQLSKRPKAVFLGDSIFDYWFNNDADFFKKHNYAARGIGGQTTSDLCKRVEYRNGT